MRHGRCASAVALAAPPAPTQRSSCTIFAMAIDDSGAVRSRAGRYFPRWNVAELPAAPEFSARQWKLLIGPGLLLAGSAIGGGEWLFGPIVTARYGGQLMWIAAISILLQVSHNLCMMRYTLYTGEPIFVGFFRTRPGPMFWVFFYLLLDLGGIWPVLGIQRGRSLGCGISRAPARPRTRWCAQVGLLRRVLGCILSADLRRQDLQHRRKNHGHEDFRRLGILGIRLCVPRELGHMGCRLHGVPASRIVPRSRNRLADAGCVRGDCRDGWDIEHKLFGLRPRQGLGHGAAGRRDPQHGWGQAGRTGACRQGLRDKR